MALPGSLLNALNGQWGLPLWWWEFQWLLALCEPTPAQFTVLWSFPHGIVEFTLCIHILGPRKHFWGLLDRFLGFFFHRALSTLECTTCFRLSEAKSQWDLHGLLRIPLSILWSGLGLQAKRQGKLHLCPFFLILVWHCLLSENSCFVYVSIILLLKLKRKSGPCYFIKAKQGLEFSFQLDPHLLAVWFSTSYVTSLSISVCLYKRNINYTRFYRTICIVCPWHTRH